MSEPCAECARAQMAGGFACLEHRRAAAVLHETEVVLCDTDPRTALRFEVLDAVDLIRCGEVRLADVGTLRPRSDALLADVAAVLVETAPGGSPALPPAAVAYVVETMRLGDAYMEAAEEEAAIYDALEALDFDPDD